MCLMRLAKRMRHMMTLAGIPAEFLSHSGRHAGINLRKEGAGLSGRLSSRTFSQQLWRRLTYATSALFCWGSISPPSQRSCSGESLGHRP